MTLTEDFWGVLKPRQHLHDLAWRRLLREGGLVAWFVTARELYFSMGATAPLLRFIAQTAEPIGGCDELRSWALEHADEEAEHAEWFKEDLIKAGLPASVFCQPPHPLISGAVGAQFHLVATVHPAAALGYFLLMESVPTTQRAIDELQSQLAIPEAALRTIRYHVGADEEHRIPILELANRYSEERQIFDGMVAGAIAASDGWMNFFRFSMPTRPAAVA